jgi:hypothetical protein
MDNFYRMLIPIALWLGIASFVLALLMMLVGQPFLFRLSPGGLLRGGQTLLLLAVAGYCAHRTAQRS